MKEFYYKPNGYVHRSQILSSVSYLLLHVHLHCCGISIAVEILGNYSWRVEDIWEGFSFTVVTICIALG